MVKCASGSATASRNGMGRERTKWTAVRTVGAAACLFATAAAPASAQRIENQLAVFAAPDKVTARISKLEVPLNQTRQFGSLKVTPRACLTRSPTEPPKTTTFVEVDEVALDGSEKRLFTGWMFAESPGLNAVEHPVFDVWLTECQQAKGAVTQKRSPAEAPAAVSTPETQPAAGSTQRRRPPR